MDIKRKEPLQREILKSLLNHHLEQRKIAKSLFEQEESILSVKESIHRLNENNSILNKEQE